MSAKPKIYITRRIPDVVVGRLAESCETEMWDEEDVPVPRDVLEEKLRSADGLYCMLTDTIDAALLAGAGKLKAISTLSVGYNHIDVAEASRRGIVVTNTPDVLTETTADLTFALLMATARRIVEASDVLREGRWTTWSPAMLTGQDIHGATLGIIGMGRIGEALGRRGSGFDMRVLYHNRSRKEEAERKYGFEYADMPTLLAESDFVCVMTPYTLETRGLIGERELGMMKASAILINTARGGIVDENALYRALKHGVIWGAGLDVFEREPVDPSHPLLTLQNVVTLPHIGSASIRTRQLMAEMAAANLLDALHGRKPAHAVNPSPFP